MPYSPKSPSLRAGAHRGPRPVVFASYDDIEALLADTVVGTHRHASTMLVYRATSTRMRDAIDEAIDRWCRRFVAMQESFVRLRIGTESDAATEERFRVRVAMETMVQRAFGSCSGVLRSVVHLSKVDRVTYLAVAVRRCVLCGRKVSHELSAVEGEEHNAKNAPEYVFAHPLCQRRHLVSITDGPHGVPKGGEPRDLHRELDAVSNLLSETRNEAVSRAGALPKLSGWYRCNVWDRPAPLPLMVWMRPHDRVKAADTLYGALGVTPDFARGAVQRMEEHSRSIREQANARRASVAKKAVELTEVYEAEIRVWLGKGKTRWRSLEHLEGVHECIMASTHIDQLINSAVKRSGPFSHGNVNAVCNALQIFSRTVELMPSGMSQATMDWLVRCATVHSTFGVLGYELQYIDDCMVDVAVNNEARSHARVLDLMQNVGPDAIRNVRGRTNFAMHDFVVTVHLTERVHFTSVFSMSHSDVCKFKYVVAAEMPKELAAELPPLTEVWVNDCSFIAKVLRTCLCPGAAMARAVALERLVTSEMFRELVNT